MQLTTEEVKEFAQDLARLYTPRWLEAYVREREKSFQLDNLIKEWSADQTNPNLKIVEGLISLLNQHKRACDLAEKLYLENSFQPDFQAAIGPFTRSAKGGNDAREALLARRDHFMSFPNIDRLTNVLAHQVCLIVGEFEIDDGSWTTTSGTGFLVGPDLVLTAMHVVEDLILLDRSGEAPEHFKVVFDFNEGDAISQPSELDMMTGVRVSKFKSADWLVECSQSFFKDGRIAEPTEGEIESLKDCLDFALIRLAEPIGDLPLRTSSSAPRGWITVGDVANTEFQRDRRIAIPQHPQGFPKQMDFGRIIKSTKCGTRVISKIETTPGSSGAPCFSKEMNLIGMHNAEYRPNGVRDGNQAIKFDSIDPRIQHQLPAAQLQDPRVLTWCVPLESGKSLPILGRSVLIEWINSALQTVESDRNGPRSGRLYAAAVVGQKAGRSFTLRILETVLSADRKDLRNVIAFGGNEELLPDRLEDFVATLGAAFGLDPGVLAGAPLRPGEGLPSESDDGDKVDRWASKKMPDWFLLELERHRSRPFNRSQWARQVRQLNDQAGNDSPDEIVAWAQEEPDVIEPRKVWCRAWIVLDDLDEQTLDPLVRSFIASLVGANIDEAAMEDIRIDIQWLFLGYVPDFLVTDDVTAEILNADEVDEADIVRFISSAMTHHKLEQDLLETERKAKEILQTASFCLELLREREHDDETLSSICQQAVVKHLTDTGVTGLTASDEVGG